MAIEDQEAIFREALRVGARSRMTNEDSTPGNASVPAAVLVHNADENAHGIGNLVLLYNVSKL
ncbi:MAG TPA: hypothetical protein VF680_17455 [Allosphingosinicella sp.]|jgi:hypothetical protein